MRPGRLNLVLALALLAVASAGGPAAASPRPGLTDAVWTVHGHEASAAASINVLTLNDQRRIDNRISAYMSSSGRLVLTDPVTGKKSFGMGLGTLVLAVNVVMLSGYTFGCHSLRQRGDFPVRPADRLSRSALRR